jgi:hypothetical protein
MFADLLFALCSGFLKRQTSLHFSVPKVEAAQAEQGFVLAALQHSFTYTAV